MKAIYYQNSNFLEQPDIIDASSLVYSNIYPFNFVPSTDEELKTVKTYVTLSVTGYRPARSVSFNASTIIARIFMHKNLFRTDYGCLRTDYLASEIHDLLDKKDGIGIGKLEFSGADEFSIHPNYHGIWLKYSPKDWN